jgi:hypothetical protein
MTMQWEIVNDVTAEDMAEYTERMRVPGGWIYRVSVYEQKTGKCTSTALTFVPDAVLYVTLKSPVVDEVSEVAKV